MLPVYNPKSFADVDLRKYHVRDIKDVLRFIEFAVSRLDESKHVINKHATRANTMEAVVRQMRSQQQKINDLYGAPSNVQDDIKKEDKSEAVIEKVEDDTNKAERDSLLDDIRSAVAEETLVPEENEDLGDRVQAEYEKYKAVAGKNRVMYYREGKMVSAKDVPEDIKQILEDTLNNKED